MSDLIQTMNNKIDAAAHNKFWIMAMTITIGTCWAAIVAMLLLQNDASYVFLGICTYAAVIPNGLAIAQTPFRWIMWSFLAGVAINTLLLIPALI